MKLDTTVDPDNSAIYEVAAFSEDLRQFDVEELESVRRYENQTRVRALQFAAEWEKEGLSVVVTNQRTGGIVKTIAGKGIACGESCSAEKVSPTKFRCNGSMPVSGWARKSGGYLHLKADKVLKMLEMDGFLETCLPEKSLVFRAFDLVEPEEVKVVILGQDPYPTPGVAMGMAFSCHADKLPASLRNIYKELADDLGIDTPTTGNLTPWAYEGVLLANTALTIGTDGVSHFDYWRSFTDTWVSALASTRSVVWVLWGNHARRWKKLITETGKKNQKDQIIIESAHPSPLSAHRGFFGSKPFSAINEGLLRLGVKPVRWEKL